MVIASLRGDLKLVISGDGDVRISVGFREGGRSRGKRETSKSGPRREQPVTPILTQTAQSREVVIESARSGVYLFRAESGTAKADRARFTLKLFEASPRERTVALGARAISGKALLCKVLMPEGVHWEDDTAFAGSLEDSESITKFNSATGLYWKEFTDSE